MELTNELQGSPPRTPKWSVKRKTICSGLPFRGPLGSLAGLAQRALAQSVSIKTTRLGSRFAHLTDDSKIPKISDLDFDTHFEVCGITISPPLEHLSSNVIQLT